MGSETETLSYQSSASVNVPNSGGQTFSGHQFNSNPNVVDIPNVVDPLSLTDFQQSQSVRFVYEDKSEFMLAFGRGDDGVRQQFAGYTNIGEDIC